MHRRSERARSRARRSYAVAVLVSALVVLAACGDESVDAVPTPSATPTGVASLPQGTSTAAPLGALGVLPATVTPTPTATSNPPSGGGGGGATVGGGSTSLGSASITRQTFGMHISQVAEPAWPDISIGAVRIWNVDSTWGALEPVKGQWDFTRLDARVALARARSASVILVVSTPPAWAASRPDLSGYGGSPSPPRDIGDWQTYVATVATRYRGQIEGYEVWNEPNLPQFFVGTPSQLGELTRAASAAIRAADPNAKVISAGFSARTGGADSYFRSYVGSGIGAAIDIVGIHIYPFPGNGPESMVGLTQHFRAIAADAGLGSKPMWNTEIGYGRTPDALIDDAAASSLILRTYLVLPAAGLDRNYWYMWDDRAFTGLYLVGPDRRTPSANAARFAEAERWLVGGEVLGCDSSGALWTCTVRSPDGPTVLIAWSIGSSSVVAAPAGTHIAYTFGGGSAAVTAGAQIRIGLAPVMFAPSDLPRLS